jgi:ribosomal-protein-serine acetyltransferase
VIFLKLLDTNDAQSLFRLTEQSREHLRKWLAWADDMRCEKDTENFIRESRKNYADQKGMDAAIVYKDQMVGVAGFHDIDWVNKSAAIGYWLGKNYTGKGIMTRVVRELTDFAFTHLHLNRVEIRAAKGNEKSRAIPERLGFQTEGCIREAEWLHNQFVDHIVYGMLKKDWTKQTI